METVEKAEQLSHEIAKLAEGKRLRPNNNPFPEGSVRAEIWDGMYADIILKAYDDTNLASLSFVEQRRECVHQAVTTLMLRRTRMLMHLDGDDIEAAAMARLRGAVADTLDRMKILERRRRETMLVVRRAVTEAAAAMLEPEKNGAAA